MAVIHAFALAARLRADRPDVSVMSGPLTVVTRDVGPFRWIVDPDDGTLILRHLGDEADSDPLPLPKTA